MDFANVSPRNRTELQNWGWGSIGHYPPGTCKTQAIRLDERTGLFSSLLV
jgi:hypothetical protein